MDKNATSADLVNSTPAAKPPVLRYFLLRTVLLLVVAALLYLLGLRGIWWVASAFLISGLISLFALSRQRDVAAGSLESAFSRLNRRINRAAAAEDDLVEEMSATRGPAAPIIPGRASEDRSDGATATAAPVPSSDSGVGVQPATHEVDSKEVDQKGRKGD